MSYVQNETIRALRERKALTQKSLHLLHCLGQQRPRRTGQAVS